MAGTSDREGNTSNLAGLVDYAHLDSFPSRDEKIRHFNNESVVKGPWGRPLTGHGLCNMSQTVSVHCTPLLDCWYCESDNATGCFEASNFKSKRVSRYTLNFGFLFMPLLS